MGSHGNEPWLSLLSVIVTGMLGGTYPVVDVWDGGGLDGSWWWMAMVNDGCRC